MLKMPAVLQILHEKFGCLPKSAYLCTRKQENDRGVEQLVARQAHNLEVVRSSRASATYAAHLRQDNLYGVQPNSGLCSIFFCYHNTATVGRLCLQNAILQGSNISIGGSTDRFDANRYDNDGESDWGEWNGREETLEE